MKLNIFFTGVLIGILLLAVGVQDKPNWTCDAEDEVLIIDNTCVHIDDLEGIE